MFWIILRVSVFQAERQTGDETSTAERSTSGITSSAMNDMQIYVLCLSGLINNIKTLLVDL